MAIFFDKQQQSFFLQTPSSTYIIEIVKGRYLSHLYWGKKIERPMVKWMELNQGRASFHPNPDRDMDFSLDTMPAEYPGLRPHRPAHPRLSGAAGKRQPDH